MKRLGLYLAGAMLTAPCAAIACACCGIDDSWRVESLAPNTYESDSLSQLQLGPGRFRISDTDEWSISSVERVGDSFVFASEVGAFYFRPRGLPEHRIVDITFITQPQYQLDDVADIYHEVILGGALELPDRAAKHFGRASLDATVVLRGLGNMCWASGTFRHWLISVWPEDGLVFVGSGVIIQRDETQQSAPADASEGSRR